MKLLHYLVVTCLIALFPFDARAQRDPPVYDSFLPQINVEHDYDWPNAALLPRRNWNRTRRRFWNWPVILSEMEKTSSKTGDF